MTVIKIFREKYSSDSYIKINCLFAVKKNSF